MIFAQEAPHYWAVGLPAMPLIPGQKRPAVSGWQLFADRQPTDEEKSAWLRVYPDGNIGLAMGPASGLVAIDIDTVDPKALEVIDSVLPPSPWRRVGSKGEVRIYKFNGERTTRIQTAEGMICEVLSKGTQIVLPPSIHPDTKKPYTANAHLYQIIDRIPKLIFGVEDMLRDALIEAGFPVGKGGNSNKTIDYVPAGQRDNKMVWHAGLLARAVTRGERTLAEALGEMAHWVEEKVEQVVGDPITVEKAQKKLIEFVNRDVHGVRKMALPSGWDDGLEDASKDQLGLQVGEDDEKWSASRIIQQVAFDFQENPDLQSEALHAKIHENLARLARSEGEITDLDEGRILKFISTQSAGTISLADLRKQLRTLRIGDIEGENHDEIARAVHEHINQFGELRFHAGQFWQWRGSHWDVKLDHEVLQVISGEFGFYPSCRKSSDYSGILKLMKAKCAKDLQQVFLRGVNFANGFLDEDLVLRDHHPDYGSTYVLPYRFLRDEGGKMPIFNQFMVDSWGHDPDFSDKVAAFQEMLGATLFSVAPQYQKAFCLFGAAGSGKSVASQVVRNLLPSGSVSSVPPHDWSDRFLPAGMYGKVLNFCGELSETKLIAGEIFKQIVEGETITAQHKNQQPFSFGPTCAQWFNSNFLPKTRDTSNGFNRRWLFIEWTRSVPASKRIPNLAVKIVELEREAIAAWAVQGYERLRAQGEYTTPSSHMALVDQMATDNNSVRYFLQTSPLIVVGRLRTATMRSNQVSAVDLYQEYWSFCLASGVVKRVAVNTFVKMMRELSLNFDFRVVNRETEMGAMEVVFDGIALAGN